VRPLGVSPGLSLRTLTSAILGLGSLGPHYALAFRASLVSYAGGSALGSPLTEAEAGKRDGSSGREAGTASGDRKRGPQAGTASGDRKRDGSSGREAASALPRCLWHPKTRPVQSACGTRRPVPGSTLRQ
jgi:hypothetical protein